MQDLKISIVQFNQAWENIEVNKSKVLNLINNLVETDLIVLPEMLLTGFSMNTSIAENYKKSHAVNWLKSLAKEKNCAIYSSLMMEENNNYFNRGLFVLPSGEIHHYDKRQLFTLAKEEEHFSAGQSKTILEYKGWNINLQICYDLRFPEVSRNFLKEDGLPNYDLCLYVANWPERRAHHWKSLLLARAIENQAFVVGVNRVGKDGKDLIYSGDSRALTPLGMDLFESTPHKEFVKTVNLNYAELNEVREKLNFLKDVVR